MDSVTNSGNVTSVTNVTVINNLKYINMNRDLIVKRIKNKLDLLDEWREANANSNQEEYKTKLNEYLKLTSELENILTQSINN